MRLKEGLANFFGGRKTVEIARWDLLFRQGIPPEEIPYMVDEPIKTGAGSSVEDPVKPNFPIDIPSPKDKI